jgi:hypothetical protein
MEVGERENSFHKKGIDTRHSPLKLFPYVSDNEFALETL